jgi:hypothetical protein
MRAVIGFLAVVMVGGGCADAADDCRNTRTCAPPPDAGVTVIYAPGDAGVECNGACVPAVVDSFGWSPVPFVFWQGSLVDLATAQCPSYAKIPSQLYYATPDQTPLSCPACACEPSTGACALPVAITLGASTMCPSDTDDAGVPFDPPSGWDGGCTTNDAIAAVDCDGGPCLATVGPVAPINAACAPTQAVATKIVTWRTAAFGCAGDTNHGTCSNPSDVCTPAAPPGFSICVSREGDESIIDCPEGYPARNIYYLGGEDDRGCAACECGPPQGDSCSSSLVSFYADDTCSMQVGAVTATSAGPMCVSIPAGSSLGSKQASAPIYSAGTCPASGGEPIGSVQSTYPITVCCQQ